MTEERSEKRRHRRRGPRRHRGEDAAAAAPPSGTGPGSAGTAAGEGERPREEAAAPQPEGREAPGPFSPRPDAAGEEVDPEGEPAQRESPEAPEGSPEGRAGRKGRRRGRRRGRRGPGETPGPAGGETPVTEAPGVAPGEPTGAAAEGGAERPGTAGQENGFQEPWAAPPIGAPKAGERAALPAPTEGAEEEPRRKGRRRRRRRGRRREAGVEVAAAAAGPGEAEEGAPPAEAEPPGEILGREEADWVAGAEGTEAGEAAVAVEGEEEAEEEVGEEAAPGRKGPRRVMLIDGMHPEEIRVVIVSDGVLDYFEVENQRKKLFKGNIYKGKVVNVAHAIEAAFVEFGGGRHGFLPLNEYCAGALIDKLDDWNEGERRPPLRPGTEIVVQVTKEESSVKGAALTSYISIAGRYLVMMLGMKRYGISKKIASEKERERIRKNMEKLEYPEHLGFIVRTVGAGRPLKDLKADLQNLIKLWHRTVEGAKAQKAPALLYEEQDIVIRTLRDNYSDDIAEVLLDSPDSHRKALDFFDVYYPKQKEKLKLYRQKRPLFAKFNLEEQIERGCARRVPLPSGGHIVIDRTEALWSIDVNSGRSSKDRDIEDTAFRTNTEAAIEAARQFRIRDIGGLIVIDFIDMENRGHIKEVERTLKEEMKKDKAKSDVSPMGKFGLVALSRQRMGISFYEVQYRDCDACGGARFLPTSDAVLVSLLRRIHEDLSREPGKELVIRAAPALLEALLNAKRDEITRIEKMCGSRVVFVADPSVPPTSFDVGGGTT